MKRYCSYLLLLVPLIVSNCDDREIDFIQTTQFQFSATLSDDFLVRNELYGLQMDIRLKDSTLENLTYRLDFSINNGTGILSQNGFPFETESVIEVEDQWKYQPTSLGDQNIILTLFDNTGASETVTIDVTIGEFIPVNFSFTSNFTETETFIQTDTEFLIELNSEDPQMEYVLNYEILEGAGEIKNTQGVIIDSDYPIALGTTKWKYNAKGDDNNQIKLKIKDKNGDELTKNLSIFVIDKIPFTITASAEPSTIRQSKSSKISISLSSDNELFETLDFTMSYTSNFGSDIRFLDNNNVSIPPNTPIAIGNDNNIFTYEPVVPGTHDITITVTDQKGNAESTVVAVSSQALQKPLVKATASFSLGAEACVPQGFGSLEECTAPLSLIIDMNGSSDQDSDLGGFITDYRITIDGIEYTEGYDMDNPSFTIGNGKATFTKTNAGPGAKTYVDVKHGINSPIRVELLDDDGQWSEILVINAPGSFPE